MARHGNARHLNRLASSSYPRISRKISKYLAKPMPGRHELGRSVALVVLLRDKLALAANAREARTAINSGNVEVNGRIIRDDRFPVGFGDVVKSLQAKEAYRIGVGKNAEMLVEKIEGKEHVRTLKVVGKYLSRGSKTMIRLYDGSAMLAAKEVKVNDSVVLADGKVKDVVAFQQGARCIVVKGRHASETGKIKEIKKGSAVNVASVKIENERGTFETPVENVMVVGA